MPAKLLNHKPGSSSVSSPCMYSSFELREALTFKGQILIQDCLMLCKIGIQSALEFIADKWHKISGTSLKMPLYMNMCVHVVCIHLPIYMNICVHFVCMLLYLYINMCVHFVCMHLHLYMNM